MDGDNSTPYWATMEFFTKIIKNFDKNGSVENFHIWLATAKGDNYLSELYRANIEFKTPDKSDKVTVIIKIMPEGNESENFIREMAVYPREISMYTRVLPILNKILKDGGVETNLSSKCVTTFKEKPTCIVMTDLAIGGYKMGKRITGLDLKHSILLIDKIAQMHGASILMELENPNSVNDFNMGFIQSESEDHTMNQLIRNGLVELSEATAVWEGYQKYSSKLINMKSTIIKRALAVTKMRHGCINVLNHGDLWTNNMLFKYGLNQDPIDVVFVDFQLSIWSSLGIDLNYFLCTSIQYNILDKMDYLIERYHKSLTDVLKKLKYKYLPTLQDVKNEVIERALFGFIALILVLPLVVYDSSNSEDGPMDMEKLLDNSENGKGVRRAVYRGENYKRYVFKLLPYFDTLGIFS